MQTARVYNSVMFMKKKKVMGTRKQEKWERSDRAFFFFSHQLLPGGHVHSLSATTSSGFWKTVEKDTIIPSIALEAQ